MSAKERKSTDMKTIGRNRFAWYRTRRFVSVLLLACSLIGSGYVDAVHAQSVTTLTLVSEPGDTFTNQAGHVHRAVLTFGHFGCNSVDANGFCAGGSWPTITGAHWIWSSQLVSPAEAVNGTQWLTFKRTFSVPGTATNVSAQIQIDGDNVFELYLNGVVVGASGCTANIQTYTFTPRLGKNTLLVRAFSLPQGPHSTPFTNPAGVTYKATISYSSIVATPA